MTTTMLTAPVERILAIDLGKYKSVACDYHAASGEVAFTTLDTGRDELSRLLTRSQPDVVVIEACVLTGWVVDLCDELAHNRDDAAEQRRPEPVRLSMPADFAVATPSPFGGRSCR